MKNMKILKVIVVIFILWVIFFVIDYNRVKNKKSPIFCICPSFMVYADGGTRQWIGLGYKVIEYHVNGYDKIVIGDWSLHYDDNKPGYSNGVKLDVYQFRGKIIEITANGIIIEPNEDEPIRKSADKIRVKMGLYNMNCIGMEAIVKYTGIILESYPVQVDTVDVKILE